MTTDLKVGWRRLFGVLLGAVFTGVAGALPGSQDLTALTWLAKADMAEAA